jgi:hypothetical protein
LECEHGILGKGDQGLGIDIDLRFLWDLSGDASYIIKITNQ